MKLEDAAKQLEALGNPTRLAIFRLLIRAGHKGSTVGDIRQRLDIPASTLSHHIAKLVHTGLVSQERESRSLNCIDDLMAFMVRNCCTGDSRVQLTD
jgi:DNA-binding transcriptional ArsR family regulator